MVSLLWISFLIFKVLLQSRVENVDFVVNTGDNFYENGIQTPDASKVRTRWYNVYNRGSLLEVPWYGVLGNHDYKGNPDAQFTINDAKEYQSWKLPQRGYRKIIGKHTAWVMSDAMTYYWIIFVLFCVENVLFVFVDTTPLMNFYRDDPTIAPQLA